MLFTGKSGGVVSGLMLPPITPAFIAGVVRIGVDAFVAAFE